MIKLLQQQTQLLHVLGDTFDAGHSVVGLQLATTIRVLVHDTNQSHALLAQLDELSTMSFVDTSMLIDPRNLMTAQGRLVVQKLTMGTGAEWRPLKEVPRPPGAGPRDAFFTTWWHENVIRDTSGALWSRKQIVLDAANKEGGAHVDPNQPMDLRALEKENSMGWTYRDPIVGEQPMLNGPLLPSVRQIAYEVELSIHRHMAVELSI